ncbi:uncharacterized protein O3C94_019165 [Discoglossus pictus]
MPSFTHMPTPSGQISKLGDSLDSPQITAAPSITLKDKMVVWPKEKTKPLTGQTPQLVATNQPVAYPSGPRKRAAKKRGVARLSVQEARAKVLQEMYQAYGCEVKELQSDPEEPPHRRAHRVRSRKPNSRSLSHSRTKDSCKCKHSCSSSVKSEARRSVDMESCQKLSGGLSEQADLTMPISMPQVAAGPGQTRHMLIIGHSYIYWACRFASATVNGLQLGVPQDQLEVRWLGFKGMLWSQVGEQVVNYATRYGPPALLLIHAGGNDLGLTPIRRLIRNMQRDIRHWLYLYPSTFLIWSEMIKRRFWKDEKNPGRIDNARVKVNKLIASLMRKLGFISLRHHKFDGADADCLFTAGGMNLNDDGLKLLMLTFEEGLQKAMALMGAGPQEVSCGPDVAVDEVSC